MIPKQPINSMRVYGTTSQYITPPSNSEIDAGVEPLDSLPADWWNWLWNQVTLEEGHTVQFCNSLFAEISTVLTAAGVTPEEANTNDLLNAIYKITQAIATTEKAGSIKSSLVSGRIYVDTEGWAEVNGLGTPSSLNTTNKEVVGAINELKTSIAELNTTLTDLITTKVEAEATARKAADTALQTSITTLDSAAVKSVNSVKPTNGNVDITVDTAILKDGSVTTAKIADGSVTNDKIAGTIPIAKGGTGATTEAEGFKKLASTIPSSTLFILEDDPLLYQSSGNTWKKSSFLTALNSSWSIFNDKQPSEFFNNYMVQCLRQGYYGNIQNTSLFIRGAATYSPSESASYKLIDASPLTVMAGNTGFIYSAAGGAGKLILHGKDSYHTYRSCAIGIENNNPIIFLAMIEGSAEKAYIVAYNAKTDKYITTSNTEAESFTTRWSFPDIEAGVQISAYDDRIFVAGVGGSEVLAYQKDLSDSSLSFIPIVFPSTASGDTPNAVGKICQRKEYGTYAIIPTNFSGLYKAGISSSSSTSIAATLLSYTGSTRNDYFNAAAISPSGIIVAVGNVLVYGTEGSLTRKLLSTYSSAQDVTYIDSEDAFLIVYADSTVSLFDASTGSERWVITSRLYQTSNKNVEYNKDAHTLMVTASLLNYTTQIFTIPAAPYGLFKENTLGTLEIPSLNSLMQRVSWLEQQSSKTT